MNFASEGGVTDFSVAPSGTYSCVLVDCEKVMRPDFNNPELQVANFKWIWETNEVGDDAGTPFRFVKFTKTWFGSDEANLTKLMDQMFGKRLTKTEYSQLTLDKVRSYEWNVTVVKAQNRAGRDINTIESVNRKQKPAATKPVVKAIQTDDIADPFA
ncbi:hypothetical protein UFOVP569_38 [uncultured Caudovirales phage]|uniref:Uncharacterized protein n=1 Tax=uncultured Caudovirales phage TaxID=2100421 RepID=A0A6J5QT68_9CAUD|nr:hypothetical protein UFOVP569_38 [uncultured Caudovirales phage]CAB4182694.1 hypothetical protein UFOVP1093_13 [uncultured Caudovirales phage]CAB4199785.1 hypothetical protein UFOVP1340_12 [uncultured Caudovirales phage]CAB4213400.1 hypothetical protein UFOVP1448_11 [uncultured Caudovirales phage]CAB4218798.1 hypothetical protein UFOVP1600_37 [uncultured Caudovirales phage]